MNVDETLREFTEKYDREFMEFVEDYGDQLGVSYHKMGFKGKNIIRAMDQFKDFLENYANYKIEYKDNEKATPQSVIVERVKKDIDDGLFIEGKILYAEAPHIIGSYIHGLRDIDATHDRCKTKMFEHGIDYDSIGDLTRFTEEFIERLNEETNTLMENFGRGSGYYTTKTLLHPSNKPKEVFL